LPNIRTSMTKIIKITRWFSGVLMIIISLILLITSGIISGVVLLFISLILLPPISQKLFKKKENERTLFGKIVKNLFIGFNILYVILILFMIIILLIRVQSPISKETLESASMGIPFLITSIISTWFFGNLVLGLFTLFTRPTKKVQTHK
jgi:hypothetical protein